MSALFWGMLLALFASTILLTHAIGFDLPRACGAFRAARRPDAAPATGQGPGMTDALQNTNPFLLFAAILAAVGLFALIAHAACDGLRELARVINLRTKTRRQARKAVDYLAAPRNTATPCAACPNCDTSTAAMIQGPRAPGGQNLCCAGCGAVYAADLNSTRVSADACIGYALVDPARRVTPRRRPTRTHARWPASVA